MSTTCQIPVTATEGERLDVLLNYSREYAQRGYPGMDEQLKEIADVLLTHDDLVLVASSAGRPKHRGAYAYLQLTGNVEGITKIHRLYQLLIAKLMSERELSLSTLARDNTEGNLCLSQPLSYYRSITSVSLSHSFKVFPNKLKLQEHYQALTLRAPADTDEQQALLCQVLLTVVKLL